MSGFSIQNLNTPKVIELRDGLLNAGLKEFTDWGLDNGEHLPYKGMQWMGSKKSTDDEEQSTLSILLADGDPTKKGTAVELESKILKQLDSDAQNLGRLYIETAKLSQAKLVLTKFGLKQGGIS